MFNALNLGYLNGGGCGDGLFNMPDLGPQASAPGQDITYPDLFLPVEDNWSAAMLHGQQDLHGRDAFRTSIDRTQASIYADDSEAWMQASYASTVLDTTPVPGPSSISPISSQTTSYTPYHFPGPTYNMGSGNLPTTIDLDATVAAADYPASLVTTIDPVLPPMFTDPNAPIYSAIPDLPVHSGIPTFDTMLGPQQGVYLPSQHRDPTLHSGVQGSGGVHSGTTQTRKRAYAHSDAGEESVFTNKQQRLLVLDAGKGQQTKQRNHRSIKFDGNSIEPDANPTRSIRLDDEIGADGKPDSGIDPKDERLRCEVCNEYFSRSDSLSRHKKSKIHKARKEAKERGEERAQKPFGRPTNYAARRRIGTEKNRGFEGCR